MPGQRETRVRQQLVRGQIAWLAAVEDRLGDVRGEIAKTNDPREIGRAHPLPLGECGKGYGVAAQESGIEPARLDQQLN
jgi:hypothetical protein